MVDSPFLQLLLGLCFTRISNMSAEAGEKKIRIDKWLWAARFFKTRSLATQAVNGGRVHLNGERIKPSRNVLPGDRLNITRGEVVFDVLVLDLSERRGPATVARKLYQETEESIAAREAAREERRLRKLASADPVFTRKPDKRDRRLIRRFIRGKQE